MIARHIKASFLQTYCDAKNIDSVQIEKTQDNSPIIAPQYRPMDRYRVTSSGRRKDIRTIFDSDTEDEEDIKTKEKILTRIFKIRLQAKTFTSRNRN